MLRFMNAANAVSLLGVCSAVAAALLAANGHVAYALAALVGSGLCDVFDGFVARKLTRTDEQRTFGQRLDTVVDACAFGITPVLVLHAAGLQSPPELALLALFACCAVWRLAYFDTVGLSEEEGSGARYYTGVPTTFASLALPLAFLAGFHSAWSLRIAAVAAALVLAVGMVSPVKVRKPSGLAYPVLTLLALGLAVTYLALGARYLPA